jgi:hypothetical protein
MRRQHPPVVVQLLQPGYHSIRETRLLSFVPLRLPCLEWRQLPAISRSVSR